MDALIARVEAAFGAVLSFGFGSADLFKFERLPLTTDLLFVVAGLITLGVVGVSVAKATAADAPVASTPVAPSGPIS